MTDRNYAVDLITFYHPDFWGVADVDGINALAEADPRAFWDKMLEAVAEAGVRGVETSIGPLGYKMALRAYGSVEGVKARLDELGLAIISGFYHDFERFGDLSDPAVRAEICADAHALAAFLAPLGGQALVIGLPMRRTKGEAPVQFVDIDYARPLAQLCNEIGATVAPLGLTAALHTEGHSVMCTARDVDLFMLLTDPLYVGLCPDSAHLLLCGSEPVAVLNRHADRLVITHWKDATAPMPLDIVIDADVHGKHRDYFCTLGQGRVHWQAWAAGHAAAGFEGWMVLEVDGSADPVTTIRDSLSFVETSVAHLMR
ncbi:sugar phosphate isomerase/epimerase [Ferrimonas balearica]|nr:sugar phosphate isomerase/epimerase [Ferrimonas balearica]